MGSYPVIARGSKLGIHTIWKDDAIALAAKAALLGAPLSVFKIVDANIVDAPGLLQAIAQVSPQTIRILRFTNPALDQCSAISDLTTDLGDLAEQMVSYAYERLDPSIRNLVHYWEVQNEPDPPNAGGYFRLGKLMIQCMLTAERRGMKLALLALDAGTPEWDEISALVSSGMFERAKATGHILSLHEGVIRGSDPVDLWWPGPIPNAPYVTGAGPMCLRYRYLYSLLRDPDRIIPLVISEFYSGGDRTNGGDIVGRLAWYDSQIRQDYYVLGVLPFTLGPSPGWEASNYELAYPRLIDYAVNISGMANAVPAESVWVGHSAQTTGYLRLRTGPSVLGTTILTTLSPGSVFPVLDETVGWVKVGQQPNAWMSKAYAKRL